MTKFLCAAALSIFAATSAQALTIDIKGVAGSGKTLWSFGGSALADDAGGFDFDQNLSSFGVWLNVGDFTLLDDLEVTSLSGNAALTIGAETRGIDLVYVDGDSTAGGDDIGFGVTGTGAFEFDVNDLISLSGSLLVMGLDVNDLTVSGLPFFGASQKLGFSDATLPMNLSVTSVTTIPLPTGLPLLTAGLGGLMLLRSRKSA